MDDLQKRKVTFHVHVKVPVGTDEQSSHFYCSTKWQICVITTRLRYISIHSRLYEAVNAIQLACATVEVSPSRGGLSGSTGPGARQHLHLTFLDQVNMANTTEPQHLQPLIPAFSLAHQNVELDIDLFARRLKGRTEITINPQSKELKSVRLNCRQCKITRITANSKVCSSFAYEEPYSKAALRWEAGVHQHHMLRRKLETQLKSPPEEELVINLPKSVRIDDLDPFSVTSAALIGTRSSVGINDNLGEPSSARTAVEQERRFTPVTIVIEYSIPYIRDGMHFVGWEEDELRYPHAYTKSFAAPGGSCCLFPCVDDLAARCTWEISIKCPKTVGDAIAHPSNAANGTGGTMNGVHKHTTNAPIDHFQSNMNAEDKALELAVICTGDMTDEVSLMNRLVTGS